LDFETLKYKNEQEINSLALELKNYKEINDMLSKNFKKKNEELE